MRHERDLIIAFSAARNHIDFAMPARWGGNEQCFGVLAHFLLKKVAIIVID
jgi:hypothetical protein